VFESAESKPLCYIRSMDATAKQGDDMAQTAPAGFGESRRKKKPGAKWDGRVSSLTIEQYREMKWGLDAGYRAAMRGGPRYSMRPALTKPLRQNSDGMVDTNVAKAFDACHNTGPKFTMGVKITTSGEIPDAPGPQYPIPSIMDAQNHPTLHKLTGVKFGSETLQVLDEEAPAPGQYDQMTFKLSGQIKRMPSWTCQGREAWNESTKPGGPAPGEYDVSRALRTGKLNPLKFNMQGKTEPVEPPRGDRACPKPGPGHYPVPGTNGKPMHVDRYKPPQWKFSQETRGLV